MRVVPSFSSLRKLREFLIRLFKLGGGGGLVKNSLGSGWIAVTSSDCILFICVEMIRYCQSREDSNSLKISLNP